jgi:demethylmenaquinone methyltransferase/2-methoxy-6-polyprenyl-1,4-benzoquinol methylase
MLAQAGLNVTGVDLSGAMLGVAHSKSPRAVSYVLGNGENLPFEPEAFDCVSVSLALHEMAYHTAMRVAVEMLRVLAPGGRLIVFDYAARENTKFALALGFLGLLERIAGSEHFANFARFTRMGGVGRFLEAFPLKIITTRAYFLGALQLIIAEKGP